MQGCDDELINHHEVAEPYCQGNIMYSIVLGDSLIMRVKANMGERFCARILEISNISGALSASYLSLHRFRDKKITAPTRKMLSTLRKPSFEH